MHSRRIASVCVLLSSFACFGTSLLGAEQIVSSAVDIRGQRHFGSRDFPGLYTPWDADLVVYRLPEYPYEERARRHKGDGLFRITLDPKTGLVTQVTVIKSTGFALLDNSAVAAIRKWRWKPGRWKEVDMPIRFDFSSTKGRQGRDISLDPAMGGR
jgi:TonB family protein